MTDHCNENYATRLQALGYRQAFIRPIWYRAHRAAGIRIPLPAVMNAAEHFYYGALTTLGVMVLLYGLAFGSGLIAGFPLGAIAMLTVLLPCLNWIRYRRARQRLQTHGE